MTTTTNDRRPTSDSVGLPGINGAGGVGACGCAASGDAGVCATADPINHPTHYTFGKYEPIDVIEDWGLEFHLANAVKYIARAKHKGNELQDLQKARWYLDRYIKLKEQEAARAAEACR